MRLRRFAFSVSLLALSMYILLPTPDEIIIHPLLGWFLTNILNLPLIYGLMLSIIIYRSLGFTLLAVALLIGGKPIYYKLKERMRKKPTPPEETYINRD